MNSIQKKTAAFKITIFILGVLSMTGCKKWLDVQPQDRVPQATLFNTEQGFKDALIGVYLSMDKPNASSNINLYTRDMSLGLMSVLAYAYDNANASSNPLYSAAYNYNYNDASLKAEISSIWNGMYNNIANLNNLLSQIDAQKSVFSGTTYQLVKGEALGLRAMMHFDIIRMFGKPPTAAGTTPAVPYVTNFTIQQTPLSTVNDALDLCLNDLRNAKSLLATADTSVILQGVNDAFTSYTQNHCNYWAVQGLMARVFLYKGNTDSADYYAKSVIGSGKFPLIQSNVAASTNPVRDRTFSQEHLFSLFSSSLLSINNSVLNNTASGGVLVLGATGRTNVYATPATDNTDWRLQSWFDAVTGGTTIVPSKFMQDNNLPYALQGLMPLIRVSEMYYIASECANKKGDITSGVNYLNLVRNARGLSSLRATTVTSDSLYTALTSEYKKEFISEGQSFFYFKRLNMNLNLTTGTPATLPSDPYTFPLPDVEKQYRGIN